jgi:hypothetical protein
MLNTTATFTHKFENGQTDSISQDELLCHLIDSTAEVQKASQLRISTPPYSVTRDLPSNDQEPLLGVFPLQPLRASIIQAAIQFTTLLLQESNLLFDAIDKAINVGLGIGGRISQDDLLPPPPIIPFNPFIDPKEVLSFNEPLPNTIPSIYAGNVESYREAVLKESGKTEQTLDDQERMMLDQLCHNFQMNQSSVRKGHQVGTIQPTLETQF